MKSPLRFSCRGIVLGAGLSLGLGVGCSLPLDGEGAEESTSAAALTSRASFVKRELVAWNASLSPASRKEKYGLMTASASDFLRGTAHLFWADNAHSADLGVYGVDTFLSGDLHLGNLGSYTNDRGMVVFGLNDFDQAVIGDYQLDLWRLATSLVLTGRAQGLSKAKLREGTEAFVEAYLDELEDERAGEGHAESDFDALATKGPVRDLLSVANKAASEPLTKWTRVTKGVRGFDFGNADLAPVTAELAAKVTRSLESYQKTLHEPLPARLFQVKAVAERLHAGLGSLGLPRYYLLLEGASASVEDDIILDVKAAAEATAYAYVATTAFASEGERIATAQRALDLHVDDALGWTEIDGTSFVARALTSAKGSLSDGAFQKAADFKAIAAQLGIIVAAAHARADQDFDPALVPHDFAATVHDFTDKRHDEVRALVWAHASSYADQVSADWTAFKKSPPQ